MTRVPFGTTSSPFLLTATLQHHFRTVQNHSETAQALAKSFYVDDLLTGAQSEAAAVKLFNETEDIMQQAGMNLQKWASNSKTLQRLFQKGVPQPTDMATDTKVLGMYWNTEEDTLKLSLTSTSNFLKTNLSTKRHVLQAANRIYDIMGLISPFTIRVKIMFQKLWELKIGWDNSLPEDIHQEWNT